MKRTLFIALALAAGLSASAQVGKGVVVDKDGNQKEVYKLTIDENGKVSFTDQSGKVKSSFSKERYKEAYLTVDPKSFAKAKELFAQKKYEEAAGLYKKAFDKYKYLGYGLPCLVGEGVSWAKAGNDDNAVRILGALLNPKIKDKVNDRNRQYWMDGLGELQKIYYAQKKYTEGDRVGKAIARGVGARPSEGVEAGTIMAQAQTYETRGMKKEALLNYMRVALLFSSKTEVKSQAVYETARLLKELGDPQWQAWNATLAKDYPQSSYVGKLK